MLREASIELGALRFGKLEHLGSVPDAVREIFGELGALGDREAAEIKLGLAHAESWVQEGGLTSP